MTIRFLGPLLGGGLLMLAVLMPARRSGSGSVGDVGARQVTVHAVRLCYADTRSLGRHQNSCAAERPD